MAALFATASLLSIQPTPASAVPAVPPFWAAAGNGTTTVVDDGTGGSPEFTYSYDPGSGGGTGEWNFFTTAASAEELVLDWSFTGLHAFFGATASLSAYVISAESADTNLPLVTEGPRNCDTYGCVGSAPSGGFSYVGTVTLSVEPGDVYGFEVTGSNADSNPQMTGRLVIDGSPALPLDCAGVLWRDPLAADGTYTIQPRGGEPFEVHCADMEGTPKEYLSLVETGPAENFASYTAGGSAPGTTVRTSYTKVRINPPSLMVDIGDRRFATSTGSLTHPDINGSQVVTSMPYGVAMACNSDPDANGLANIDLRGTAFEVNDTFTPEGITSASFGGASFSASDQVVDVAANGNCGWRTPYPTTDVPPGPFFQFNLGEGYHGLQLRRDAPGLPVPAILRAISLGGPDDTTVIVGRVAGSAGQSITIEVSTAASCADGVLAGGAIAGSGSATTDPDGYFAAEVDGVPNGAFATYRVTAPAVSPSSTCLVSSGDNDFWPKALEMSGAAATARDFIDQQGKARWYKFTVTPGQRITHHPVGPSG